MKGKASKKLLLVFHVSRSNTEGKDVDSLLIRWKKGIQQCHLNLRKGTMTMNRIDELGNRIAQVVFDRSDEVGNALEEKHGPQGGRNAKTMIYWSCSPNGTITRAIKQAGLGHLIRPYWSGKLPTPSSAIPICIYQDCIHQYRRVFGFDHTVDYLLMLLNRAAGVSPSILYAIGAEQTEDNRTNEMWSIILRVNRRRTEEVIVSKLKGTSIWCIPAEG